MRLKDDHVGKGNFCRVGDISFEIIKSHDP